MLSTIVIGVDGRPGADDAVALGRALARLDDARLVVVAAYPSLSVSGSTISWNDVVLERDALAALDRARAQLGDAAGVDYEAGLGAAPGLTLQDVARERGAGLVVIGATQRSRLGRVLGGTLLEQTLRDADCPVAVAPRGYAGAPSHAIATVGIAYDGTPEADGALRFGAALAAAEAVPVEALEIVFVDTEPPGPERRADGTAVPDAAARTERIDSLLERAGRAVPERVDVSHERAYGEAAEHLAALSERVDLLVTGTHGRGPLGRLVHGSVSGEVAARAACPVVAVPRAQARAGDAAPRLD